MEYMPYPYRKPSHLEAICASNQFADFVIDQALYYEDGEVPDWSDSFVAYKKWRNCWRSC